MKSRGSSLPRLEWLEHRCCPSRTVEYFDGPASNGWYEHAEHHPPGVEVAVFRHGPFVWILIQSEPTPVVNNGGQNGTSNVSGSSDDLDVPLSATSSDGPGKSTTGSGVTVPATPTARSVATPAPLVKPSLDTAQTDQPPAARAAPPPGKADIPADPRLAGPGIRATAADRQTPPPEAHPTPRGLGPVAVMERSVVSGPMTVAGERAGIGLPQPPSAARAETPEGAAPAQPDGPAESVDPPDATETAPALDPVHPLVYLPESLRPVEQALEQFLTGLDSAGQQIGRAIESSGGLRWYAGYAAALAAVAVTAYTLVHSARDEDTALDELPLLPLIGSPSPSER